MRPRPLTAAAILLLEILTLVLSFAMPKDDVPFTPWIRVVTRDERTEELGFCAVSRDGRRREIEPFACQPTPALHTHWDAYTCDFVQEEKRRRLQLHLQSTTLYDINDQPLEATAEQRKLLRRIEKDIRHDVMTARLFSIPQGQFVQLSFNVNWCWPKDLYLYHPAADTLTMLAPLDAQEIIAVSAASPDPSTEV